MRTFWTKTFIVLATILSFFVFFFSPMILFRLLNGIPFDANGAGTNEWIFLIIGCGLGPGISCYVCMTLCKRLGVDNMWK